MDETKDKFATERKEIIKLAKEGIKSNIPLSSLQKKYLKNLLFFSMMKAAANETVQPRNFIKLVNKTLKKFLLKIFRGKISHADDEDYYDENLEVELNNIIAQEQLLNLQQLSEVLTPKNIIEQIRRSSEEMSSKEIIKQIMTLRQVHENQRETPEEARKREQRIRKYEREKIKLNTRFRGYERDRSRS